MKNLYRPFSMVITVIIGACLCFEAIAQTVALENTMAMTSRAAQVDATVPKNSDAIHGQLPKVGYKNVDILLQESWQAYRKHFIKPDGRVVDPDHQITTSEGQSYAMLRSVFMDDQNTFDRTWTWTKQNLTRADGKLFAWLWGKRKDGSWGTLDQKTASDADEDIALALIIGSSRWHKTELLDDAKLLVKQIWDVDIITANGKSYLGPGNWAKHMAEPMLNPSYFAPYAYRLFAKIDPQHDWQSVVNTSYDVLNHASNLSKLQLPPDWCDLNRDTGRISLDLKNKNSDYSWDAIRVPWRISLDWQWNHDKRAKHYLKRLSFLLEHWNKKHTLFVGYTASGVLRKQTEALCAFGCVLPHFALLVPSTAQQVLKEKLISQYNNGSWDMKDDYYGQNWAWFGIALMFEKLAAPQVA